MKTLYNLVKFKRELSSIINEISLKSEINNKINLLNNILQNNEEVSYLSKVEEIKNSYNYLLENDQQQLNTIKTFIDQLSVEIENLGLNDFSKNSFNEESLRSQMTLDEPTKDKITSKISQYCSVRYPGLQILAREKHWIVPMVSCDPLYLTRNKLSDLTSSQNAPTPVQTNNPLESDVYSVFNIKKDIKFELELLEELIADYPESYQRRVGLYVIKNRDFSLLPQNQFGFVLCWDNFDYLTVDIILTYLQEVFRLLRPGGVFMFSYTNCELELSALKVDYKEAPYCSSTWLLKVLADIGYDIISLTDYTSTTPNWEVYPISWAEVRKPGQLSTAKISQAQGLIKRK